MATGVSETLYSHPDVKQLPYGHGRDYSKGISTETVDDKILKVRALCPARLTADSLAVSL